MNNTPDTLIPVIGVITDAVSAMPGAVFFAQRLGMAPEQLGMKAGMLLGAIFPLIAIFVYAVIWRARRTVKNEK